MLRLGDGTETSKKKIQAAVNDLWMFTGELTQDSSTDQALFSAGIAPSIEEIRQLWHKKVESVLKEATLTMPSNAWMQSGGKTGRHTEHLGYILAEMQHLQRTYPGLEW